MFNGNRVSRMLLLVVWTVVDLSIAWVGTGEAGEAGRGGVRLNLGEQT